MYVKVIAPPSIGTGPHYCCAVRAASGHLSVALSETAYCRTALCRRLTCRIIYKMRRESRYITGRFSTTTCCWYGTLKARNSCARKQICEEWPLASSCPSVRLSVFSLGTTRFLLEGSLRNLIFDILSREFKFHYSRTTITATLRNDQYTFYMQTGIHF